MSVTIQSMLSKLLQCHSRFLVPSAVFATHTPTCPSSKTKPASGGVCPGSGSKGGGSVAQGQGPKRALQSGKVRLAFIPEEWFLFFHSKTGVTGPYLFGITVINYWVSKEIFVMEHEYYCGLSIFVMVCFAAKNIFPMIAASLDKSIDEMVAELEKGRKDEMEFYEATITDGKEAQSRAEGQKLLMDAKKENILMQLEAEYRARLMHVHQMVKGRLDYHAKRYRTEARIHQKWMVGWILENVRKSITPEFEQQALNKAIEDLAAAAGRAQ